jgi:cysteinyl-tRNA synthetase
MTLSIYNTLTRKLEPFVPLQPGRVGMYVCGVTVYDYCHIGHGRTFVAFDVIRRWLRARGYAVNFVRNITDIDDKIIRRAAERGVGIDALTAEFTQAMQDDLAALGCEMPDAEPRATQFVPQMLDLIGLLQKNKLAYQAADDDVNFAVRKLPGYGKLSNRSLDDLRAGERVAVDSSKRDPLDFVLWKAAKPDEPSWPSPWGAGRPGWHIECSAMARELLGQPFDIHGGGPDLVFPHHENEIAQSEGALGTTFARVWMHTGALRVGEDKMSKSLGNFWTIRDALAKYDGEVLRFFLLRSHYRSQVAFDETQVAEARVALTRLYTALRDVVPDTLPLDWHEPFAQRFAAAMDDDFNTPIAVAALFELAGEVNRTKSPEAARQLKSLSGVLGLLQRPAEQFLRGARQEDSAWIEASIAARNAAKKAKNFAEADRIRAELMSKGIVLEDKPAGLTEWRRK